MKYFFPFFLLLFLCNCSPSSDNLISQFETPAQKFYPGIRWWWNGNALTQKEVIRELDVFNEAGISTISIIPIELPEDVKKLPDGYKEIQWLSDEWIEMLDFTIVEAIKRNLDVHLSIGQGWPLGDILKKYPNQLMVTSQLKLQGPLNFSGNAWNLFDLPQQYKWRGRTESLQDSAIYVLRLVPDSANYFTAGEDLLSIMKSNGDIKIFVPPGKYTLCITQWQKGYTYTKHNPDKDIILDYLHPLSVQETMDSAFVRYSKLTHLSKIKTFFHDSWELDEQNWTDDFKEQFKIRRGYDIEPYLPFVSNFYLTENEDSIPFYDTVQKARYDFISTINELFEERTMAVLKKWCDTRGYPFRNQAYGREQHPLDANLYPDIPEGESWIRNGKLMVPMINRYVASAAQLYGKKVITCETCTNVDAVYKTSLSEIKQLTDQTFLSGMTQLMLHGYNYSPSEAGIPGWVAYGTYFSINNPWWPYFKKYSEYVGRVSSVLQNSEAQANIAIITPDIDIWKKHSRLFRPFPEVVEPWYIYEFWQAAHCCGYNLNYTSEQIINLSKIEDGKLVHNNRSFELLIFEDLESIHISTLEKLKNYVKNGGKMVFIGQMPSIAPGLNKTEDEMIVDFTQDLLSEYSNNVWFIEGPKQGSDLVYYIDKLFNKTQVQPDLNIVNPNKNICQIFHKTNERNLFFLVNLNPNSFQKYEFTFRNKEKNAYLWDPQSGKKYKLKKKNSTYKVYLPAASSWFLVFENEDHELPIYNYQPADYLHTLNVKQWNVSCFPVVGKPFHFNTEKLIDLSKSDDSFRHHFSGTIIYKANFFLDTKINLLKIPVEKSITELMINDKIVGVRYFGNHEYDVSKYIQKGNNSIEIKVTTTLENYMSDKNTLAKRWEKQDNEYLNIGIVNAIHINP